MLNINEFESYILSTTTEYGNPVARAAHFEKQNWEAQASMFSAPSRNFRSIMSRTCRLQKIIQKTDAKFSISKINRGTHLTTDLTVVAKGFSQIVFVKHCFVDVFATL